MWLKRLVGSVLIVTLLGMNVLIILGLVVPEKKKTVSRDAPLVAVAPLPAITLSLTPTQIPAQTTAAISWSTTGNPTDCEASGAWQGQKTMFGAESTGRIPAAGNYTYTLTCKNSGGSTAASAVLTVGNATPPKQAVTVTNQPATPTGTSAVYCGGRTPCYGPKDVAAHGSAGNCWGYNIDRVVDISHFDAEFHQTKSGISSIEISGVCGKDLAPALSGGLSAGGAPHNHNQTTKTNADKNEASYFVGYFDANK